MGADGGSLPHRAEMVKTKKGRRTVNRQVNRIKWSCCTLTKKPLEEPVVLCPLGRLFNKQDLLVALMKKKLPNEYSYITSIKDLITLKLTQNKNYSMQSGEENVTRFICPISGIEMNGLSKFVAFSKCGHVVAKTSIEKLQLKACPLCDQTLNKNDIKIINPDRKYQKFLLKQIILNKKKKQRKKKRNKNKKSSSRKRKTKTNTKTIEKIDNNLEIEKEKISPNIEKKKLIKKESISLTKKSDKNKRKEKEKENKIKQILKKKKINKEKEKEKETETEKESNIIKKVNKGRVYNSIFFTEKDREKFKDPRFMFTRGDLFDNKKI
ncbi:protein c20orf43 [Anaeramoeba flamelloides]|uniref:Protein c20orf43 n=1 Tax=Anaeramoeba flamelloides TaxID=1746091 RepID=A0ABQ8Y088_9EUKA|nr:protein c20orf43 [Anaeramoeba flamelloides]